MVKTNPKTGMPEVIINIPSKEKLSRLKPIPIKSLKEYGDSFAKHIETLCKMLKINEPKIMVYPFLFDIPEMGQGAFDHPKGLRAKSIPLSLSHLHGASAWPEKNSVLVSYYNPLTAKPFTEEQLVFHMTHELRHFWQYKYYHNRYYKKENATGEAYANDLAEIDADAFALAYCYQAGINVIDLPESTIIILVSDNRKRLSRAYELYNHYFPNGRSLDNFRTVFTINAKGKQW